MYFFLVSVLLVVLIFKLGQTNEYLKVIAENGKNSIEYETFDDTFIEVITEENKDKEDYIPLLENWQNKKQQMKKTQPKNRIILQKKLPQ